MPIPFPKIHIAESVLNRLLNAVEGEPSLGMTDMMPPASADPTASGLALDESLQQPPMPVAVPKEILPAAEQGMIESSVMGGSPFDGALIGAGGAAGAPPR